MTAGAPRKFNSPEELEQAFDDYKEWVHSNPIYHRDFIRSGERAGDIVNIPISRPLSVQGFCEYLHIDDETLKNYGKLEGREEFFGIYTRIRNDIAANQITGAVAGVYKENIVARMNHISDKQDIEHSGSINIAGKIAEARARKQKMSSDD